MCQSVLFVVQGAISADHNCINRAILQYSGGHHATCIAVETCPTCHAEDGFLFGAVGQEWNIRSGLPMEVCLYLPPIPGDLTPGDLIVSEGRVSLDHECHNWAVLQYTGNGAAKCIKVKHCEVCSPPSNPQPECVYALMGETWRVNETALLPATGKWADLVHWEEGVS